MKNKNYNFDEAANTFFSESRDMLQDMENELLTLEKDNSNSDCIPTIFRAVHTIKGSAGMFGFDDISHFAHDLENLMDLVRNGEVNVDPEMVNLFFNCHDFILMMIDFFDENREAKLNAENLHEYNTLVSRINNYLNTGQATDNADEEEEFGVSSAHEDSSLVHSVENRCWHISLRFNEDICKNGLDPQSFISYLGTLGEIVHIQAVHDPLPSFKEMDPQRCYLGFEIDFLGETTREQLLDVFDFLRDDSTIRILPPLCDISRYVELIDERIEENTPIGKILVNSGALTAEELDEVMDIQKSKNARLGEIMSDEKIVHQGIIDAAVEKQKIVNRAVEKSKKIIKVNTDKLDDLVNLIGELVISSANISQKISDRRDEDLMDSISSMGSLINDIRDSSMGIRMVQIGDSFKRFERAVRDLSRESGKKVELILNGADTELDKTIIEKITDPLLHIIRNSVDHGIDTPVVRERQGKPSKGTINLNAYHEKGNVVISITDDGNGLNREKIEAKAVKNGLINPDEAQNLTDEDVYKFIFIPGFSTSEKVTEISGRGVGMDVVKKNIESLRGSVEVQSLEGRGTSIYIKLPLTLAIIDGFCIQAGNLKYIIPLEAVVECLNINDDEVVINEKRKCIKLRGELLPCLNLREFFNEPGEKSNREKMVVVENFGRKVSIIVDETLGEYQTVIKPLGRLFSKVYWMSGSTILGNGEVALILDVPRFINYIKSRELKAAG